MASRIDLPPTPVTPLIRPFQRFAAAEAAGGIVLLVCAALALAWANSPAAGSYFALWQQEVTVGAGPLVIQKPLLLWINDGLMAIFFFLVGLEIKREILVGELKSPRKAALAIAAALGGMAVPALFYLAFNAGGPGAGGWGIPMATDIAFALGVLALLGKRAPLALKVFLTAVAIVDDLGAVLVIAFFYTAKLSVGALMGAAAFFAVLVVMNLLGVRRTAVYVLLGIGLWVCFLKSGVHATIGGVLLALTIPARGLIDAPSFMQKARDFLFEVEEDAKAGRVEPTADQGDAIHSLSVISEHAQPPLTRMEHALHGWVAFFIMPVFALANAGVAMGGDLGALVSNPVALGIVAGLVLGKPVGVFLLAWLAVKTGVASLPAGVNWKQVLGVACLTGIGFTMSIFIASLAFTNDPLLLDSAKTGILLASLISGAIGLALLKRFSPPPAPIVVDAPARPFPAESVA
jgi:NhaA family Na+:H+ antiporter